jgi:hypothetical protein
MLDVVLISAIPMTVLERLVDVLHQLVADIFHAQLVCQEIG